MKNMLTSIISIFKKPRKGPSHKEIMKVAEEQLKQNRAIIESLRDYDMGRKDIPTNDVERRLHNIRVTL